MAWVVGGVGLYWSYDKKISSTRLELIFGYVWMHAKGSQEHVSATLYDFLLKR
jgi:hypothetical protein